LNVIARGSMFVVTGRDSLVASPHLFLVRASGSVLEIRDFGTGGVLGQISLNAGSDRFGAAQDGSFVWTVSTTGISLWSPTGAPLTTFATNAATNAEFFATSNDVRACTAGTTAMRIVAKDGSASLAPAFAGTFVRWFGDSARFLTDSSGIVRVYSPDVQQLKLVALPSEARLGGGLGDYFWAYTSTALYIYSVSGAAAPALTIETSRGSATSVVGPGMLTAYPRSATGSTVGVVNLLGSSPTLSELSETSVAQAPFPSLVAADGSTGETWVSSDGALLYRASGSSGFRPLSCGNTSIHSSAVGDWFLTTGAGQTLVVDADQRRLERVLPFSVWHAQVSEGGTVAAGYTRASNRRIHVYSAEDGSLLRDFAVGPFDLSRDGSHIALSRDGSHIAYATCESASSCQVTVARIDSGASYTFAPPATLTVGALRLSPAGARIAVGRGTELPRISNAGFGVFQDGTLVGAGTGYPGAWIDEERLLVATYVTNRVVWFDANVIVDYQGLPLVRTPVPQLASDAMYVIEGGLRVHARNSPNVFDIGTGASLWPGQPLPSPAHGGAADARHVLWTNLYGDVYIRVR
jgi:hypothetical protein